MRSVCAGVADDGQSLAVLKNCHAVVEQQRHLLAAGNGLDSHELLLVAVVGERRAVGEVPRAICVDDSAPFAVIEDNAVKNRPCVCILLRSLLEGIENSFKIFLFALLVLTRRRVGGVPLGNALLRLCHCGLLALHELLLALSFHAACQPCWEELKPPFDAQTHFFQALGPRTKLEDAPGESCDAGCILELFYLAHVHIAIARAIDNVDDLPFAIRSHLKPCSTRVDARVENRDLDAAAVPFCILGDEGRCSRLFLGQDAFCGKLHLTVCPICPPLQLIPLSGSFCTCIHFCTGSRRCSANYAG
mmetsp:Transcript_33285/g.78439  ORF Transcript_33285/g.78439 Transcript_33285/m.78439 type:complete len:304 (+) Transcript_33285:3331-4242(+)